MRSNDELAELVRALSPDDAEAAGLFLEWLAGGRQDGMLLSLASAPFDDEPLTEEDLAALRESEEDQRAGRVCTTAEVRARLGMPEKEKDDGADEG